MEKDDYTTFFKKRLDELVKAIFGDSRGSSVKFADSLETSPGHVRDWLGEARPSVPGAKYLGRIYEIHKVNLNWLIPGDINQPMFKQENTQGAPLAEGPAISTKHIQQAVVLLREALRTHRLPEKSEGYIVGELAEGFAQGKSREYLLQKLTDLIEMVVGQRSGHRRNQ